MAMFRQALSCLPRAVPHSFHAVPKVPTTLARRGASTSKVQCNSLRLFNDGDDDFFSNPAKFLLDPRSVYPSLLTGSSNWQAPTAKTITLDVLEEPDAFIVKGDFPGVEEKNILLQVDGDVLSLGVHEEKENRETKEEGGVKVHRMERSRSFNRRAIRLPESARTEEIAAELKNGVLTVNIPKQEKAPRQRKIAIGKGNGTKTIEENTASKEGK